MALKFEYDESDDVFTIYEVRMLHLKLKNFWKISVMSK